jgi:arylsulfatase A-like enzyme
MSRPNVLLLSIDALRRDMLASFGGDGAHTPCLDAFARRGICFTQAITGGSWTQAAFPPILTSSHAGQYGGCLGSLSPARPSPVTAFQEAGYTTIGISSNPWLSRYRGYARGFTRFHDLAPARPIIRLRRVRGGQILLRTALFHRLAGWLGRNYAPPPVYVHGGLLTQTLLDEIRQAAAPWFLWAHYMDIHWPYHLSHQMTAPRDIAQAWVDIAHFHKVGWKNAQTSPAQLAHYQHLYRAALQYLDGQVGMLLATLANENRLDNTIIVLLADHGEEFLEHGKLGHLEENYHDETLRVPLVVQTPFTGALTLDRQVRTLDLMPTLLDLCQLPPPAGLEGISLAPLWRGDPAAYDVPFVISERPRSTDAWVSVRTPAHKYVWLRNKPDEPILYDLASDPAEQVNVAAHHPDIVRALHARVETHLAAIAATASRSPVSDAAPSDERMLERLRDLGYVE